MPKSTGQSQQQANETEVISKIRELHEQAQRHAQSVAQSTHDAIESAKEAGRLLKAVKGELGSAKFKLWCEGHFDESFAEKWANRYIQTSQLELNWDDADAKSLRLGMASLDLMPREEREVVHSAPEDARKFEQRLISRINGLLELSGRIPEDQKRVYRSQYKELFEWMKRELFN